MARVRLTTYDNPYNPFLEYVQWHTYDCKDLGWSSAEYLARISYTSDQLSEYENEQEIERAIDEIIALDPFNIYRKCPETETIEETRKICSDYLNSLKTKEG